MPEGTRKALTPEGAMAEAEATGTLVERATASQQLGREGTQTIPCLLSLLQPNGLLLVPPIAGR